MTRPWLWMALTFNVAAPAAADPCGLVPPVRLMVLDEAPIERTGVQQTWVFHRAGIETIAIRPGFEGRADEFGMLVPLPAVPTLHKTPDDLFTHLATVVQPPKVNVEIKRRSQLLTKDFLNRLPAGRSFQAAVGMQAGVTSGAPSKNWLEVVSEEGIGEYEVAILRAGSPEALERWMLAHEYAYPVGMDEVVVDYVERGWVFAAVKARLGRAAGVAPMPGMTGVDRAIPSDAPFTGFVQGMAFRFEVDQPVVPMRLSTFNGDDTHNRVFVLAEGPVRIAELPEGLVQRQIAGSRLLANFTQPLDVEVQGGRIDEVPAAEMARLDRLRNPEELTWAAAELVSADLLAADTGQTALAQETWALRLVNVSAAVGLKGPGIDRLQREVVRARFGSGDALALLEGTTLTVIEGQFDHEVLRHNDLHFVPWEMPAWKNRGVPFEDEELPKLTAEVWI